VSADLLPLWELSPVCEDMGVDKVARGPDPGVWIGGVHGRVWAWPSPTLSAPSNRTGVLV
jgi:hypothetical protein